MDCLIVHSAYRFKFFLACRVPDLHLYLSLFQLVPDYLLLLLEIYSDALSGELRKFIFDVAVDEACLSNVWLAEEHYFVDGL